MCRSPWDIFACEFVFVPPTVTYMSCSSCLSRLNSLWDGKLVDVQLLFCRVLFPGFFHRTQDVTQKTCRRRWMIGRSGERWSRISVLAAQHDDDDDMQHSFLVPFYLFSMCFVSVHEVHPYSSMDIGAAWKIFHFILSNRLDFSMTNSLLIAPYIFARHRLTSLLVKVMLLPRIKKLISNFWELTRRAMARSC